MMRSPGSNLKQVARICGIPYSSLRRWTKRQEAGEELIREPGPGKSVPLDLERFTQALEGLKHGPRRSHGAGAIHASFNEALSRRKIDAAIRESRKGSITHPHEVQWLYPNLCWALDDTQFAGRSRNIHTIRDLASRFQLDPITGNLASGEQVAAHLEELFQEKGAPLFLKRDNGSNLNHEAVDEVLARWHVIPLNSPVRCPQYNGAVENAQKDWDRMLDPSDPEVVAHLDLHAQIAANHLNHNRRRVLGNRTPCIVFHGPNRLKINKIQRKKAYEQITQIALELVSRDEQKPSCAWRKAVLSWLLMNRMINLKKTKCVTPFSKPKCS